MSLPIFLAYMDYCIESKRVPDAIELQEWKKKYNNR